ncbi:phosphate ABC transporter substrate-binding protein PstS [Streptomyces sp. CA-210063]|uniref:phosphate ABC transporter substrate-binding protein PstS n=1 Tax=Streptomyces sp. CA-210063 TaxID=2801029 RepID=UPI00214B2CEE|nr:phosphate ABC transporter substrate-binding protein PstS [Streptomyces sp. CA-210063]UUU31301.1 phosphate ABC transporter substrate-binding protein PstS [Streptomyces sp. CA-210063]
MKPATRFRLAATVLSLLCALVAAQTSPAHAASYAKITGSGSTWSANAVTQWVRNVKANFDMTVNFTDNGSSQGREQFKNNVVDFAVSEIPYGLKEQGVTDAPPQRGYAYMPIVAGGTSFMYNLKINGKKVTNLRLSGDVIAKIFTGRITRWNDAAIRADNPGLTMPARQIVPVVRSDGSGTSAQFTMWMAKEQAALWNDYCKRTGRGAGCGMTSNYPLLSGSGMVSKAGSLGVSGHVRQPSGEGAITYVEYSYAEKTGFPVAKVLNRNNYYVEPTASSVAVALTRAEINRNKKSVNYLTQILDNVYRNNDPRTYPLSSYSYMILPTKAEANFTEAKGNSLGTFGRYFLCDGQQHAERLGYSPLPKNLVEAGFEQLRKVPGAPKASININNCRNPTFSSDGTNTLAKNAPYPKACDKKGTTQCSDGTAGASEEKTPVKPGANGGDGNSGGSGSGGGAATGGSGATGGTGGTDTDGDGQADTATGGSTAAGTTGGTVDPDTGEVISAGDTGTGDTSVAANPVSLASGDAFGMRGALMSLSAVLLVAVVIGPPLTARVLAARTRRKGEMS